LNLPALFLAAGVSLFAFGHRSGTALSSAASTKDDMKAFEQEFAGSWDIRETDEPSAADQKPLTGTGTELYRAEPGGMPFVEQYHSDIDGRKATESAYFWWDASAKKLRGLWCSTFNDEGCSPFQYHREGNGWLMEGEYVSKNERFAWRESFTKEGPDAFRQILTIGKPGAELKPAATIHATRRK